MSKTGAAEPAHAENTGSLAVSGKRPRAFEPSEAPFKSAVPDDFFLPDFCAARSVLAVVLIVELLAVTLTLARPAAPFLDELARVSLFAQWLGLTSAGLLCFARAWLARLSVAAATVAVFILLMANTALVSEAALRIGAGAMERGVSPNLFPEDRWSFLMRNEGICVIVAAMLLRYFFVANQWRHHVRAEARSRIEALQARIRPHFLFNSMNTIASLTRTDPKRAEEAVEDLADLFRATLRDTDSPLRLKDELELTRIYQRIEELRLGSRLVVRWNVAELPMRALVPGLTIQPLLENAIYHGIEPLPDGGTVTVSGRVLHGQIEIEVANPVQATAGNGGAQERSGNRIALDNIRQRLALAYGERGRLDVERSPEQFRVTLRIPFEQ